MVVWGYPCESKSSPAHYSKHPQAKAWGCFFVRGIYSKIKYSKNKVEIVEDVKEAIRIARNLKTGKKRRIILLENDLPDNY